MSSPSAKSTEKIKGKSRFDRANICSRWAFSWLNRLVGAARKETLVLDDLDLPKAEHAEVALDNFNNNWQKETKTDDPSLFRALRKSFWGQFVIAGFYKFLWGAFVLLSAYYFVRAIVAYVQVYFIVHREILLRPPQV